MTGDEFQEAIDALGLTQVESAAMLGVNGRTVRRWIGDDAPIPHPVVIVLGLMRKFKIKPAVVKRSFPFDGV